MARGGMSCNKYMIFYNGILGVCGVFLIAAGAIFLKAVETPFSSDPKYVTVMTILIVVGGLTLLLGLWGTIGADRKSYCMITTFGILLVLLFVIELAAGITVLVKQSELEGYLKKEMNNTFIQGKNETKKMVDDMQWHNACCGVTGPGDYPEDAIPESCCPKGPEGPEACTRENAFLAGCYERMDGRTKTYIKVVGGVSLGIAGVELLGVVFSWCLASSIKRERIHKNFRY